MSDITLEHVIAAAHTANGIRIVNSGSGTLEDIQIALSTISGSAGSGIVLERSAGMLRDIFIADTVNIAERR